ncbi:MAG: ferritin-like domain-containing protein [Actinobacteria bacterium]|nr:ferritin-like domain-containing protein [Actinomycetota bacterium]
MTYLPKLEELDVDGAIQETAAQVDPETRASFLKKAGIGVGALAAGSAFAGAMPSMASAQAIPASDIAILNFALTLEYLEGEFYAKANANKVWGNDLRLRRFSMVVGQHEAVHVQFLKKVLGAKAVAKPTFDFKDTVTNKEKFAATAQALEDTGVHAYLGQVPNIKAKAVLVPAGRIALVEARHAAWIRDVRFNGGTTSPTTPAPGAFEDPFTMARVLAIVKATGFIVG